MWLFNNLVKILSFLIFPNKTNNYNAVSHVGSSFSETRIELKRRQKEEASSEYLLSLNTVCFFMLFEREQQNIFHKMFTRLQKIPADSSAVQSIVHCLQSAPRPGLCGRSCPAPPPLQDQQQAALKPTQQPNV